jgi:peptidyl-prolyl cis-trans isomerase SurA
MASWATVNATKCRQASGKSRRKSLSGLLLSCALLFSGALLAQAVPLDRIIAIAEEDVILKSEFETRWAQVKQQLAANPNPMTIPPEAILKRQLLDQLIIESLQLQNAQRVGIRIDDNQLNEALNEIAGQSGYNFQDFTNLLQAQGIYQETREALRKEIIINNYENSAVNRRISVSRQEVENYLRSEAGISTVAPEYHVAHILIPSGTNSSADQRAELAELLHRELVNGADIVQMTASRQISGIPISGGDLGWNKPENLPSLFRDFVPSMQIGEIRPPFTSESGHHIVKLLETRGGAVLNVEQFKVRHILITPNIVRTEEQSEQFIHELYERIKAGEDFADIARQNTNDSGSMASGGDLDWVEEGMLPPDFIARVRQTPVGSISEPFRVSTGWHIVEVSDRRIQDITEENKRFQAQRILRDRKFENERQNWLTELRDTSHIEIFDY